MKEEAQKCANQARGFAEEKSRLESDLYKKVGAELFECHEFSGLSLLLGDLLSLLFGRLSQSIALFCAIH
jgi:hypothetical protein